MWLQSSLFPGEKIAKDDPRVLKLKAWVDAQYAAGRVTTIGNNEMHLAAGELL
jgi:hypothetical protein